MAPAATVELPKRQGFRHASVRLPGARQQDDERFGAGQSYQPEVTPVSESGPYRFTPSMISEALTNDCMKEVYPAAVAAG
jgi:branched-chain amino acid aminotransferase